MSRNATKTLKVTPEVKARLDNLNRDGETISNTIDDALASLERTKERLERMPAWTYGGMNNQPILEVDRIKPGSNGRIAELSPCPLCGEEHRHGFPKDGIEAISSTQSTLSHRQGHCHDSNVPNGYYLIITENTDNAVLDDDGKWVVKDPN